MGLPLHKCHGCGVVEDPEKGCNGWTVVIYMPNDQPLDPANYSKDFCPGCSKKIEAEKK